MKLISEVNLTQKNLLILCTCLLFASCKHVKPELYGKWKGNSIENCPQKMFSNGLTVANYEFLKEGVCKLSFEGSNGVGDAIVDFPNSKYELTEDSLILIFTDNVYARLSFKYVIKDENNIMLSRSFENQDNPTFKCNSVTELTRDNN